MLPPPRAAGASRRASTALGLLAVLTVFALAGCGGAGRKPPPAPPTGSHSTPVSAPHAPPAASYRKQIGALGARFAARSARFSKRIRRARTRAQIIAAFRSERDAAKRSANELAALRPPPFVARPHRQLIHGLRALAVDIEGAIRAARRGQRRRLRALGRRFAAGRLRSLREITRAGRAIDARLAR